MGADVQGPELFKAVDGVGIAGVVGVSRPIGVVGEVGAASSCCDTPVTIAITGSGMHAIIWAFQLLQQPRKPTFKATPSTAVWRSCRDEA